MVVFNTSSLSLIFQFSSPSSTSSGGALLIQSVGATLISSVVAWLYVFELSLINCTQNSSSLMLKLLTSSLFSELVSSAMLFDVSCDSSEISSLLSVADSVFELSDELLLLDCVVLFAQPINDTAEIVHIKPKAISFNKFFLTI